MIDPILTVARRIVERDRRKKANQMTETNYIEQAMLENVDDITKKTTSYCEQLSRMSMELKKLKKSFDTLKNFTEVHSGQPVRIEIYTQSNHHIGTIMAGRRKEPDLFNELDRLFIKRIAEQQRAMQDRIDRMSADLAYKEESDDQ